MNERTREHPEREWGVRFPSGRIVSHEGNEASARDAAEQIREFGMTADVVSRPIAAWEVA